MSFKCLPGASRLPRKYCLILPPKKKSHRSNYTKFFSLVLIPKLSRCPKKENQNVGRLQKECLPFIGLQSVEFDKKRLPLAEDVCLLPKCIDIKILALLSSKSQFIQYNFAALTLLNNKTGKTPKKRCNSKDREFSTIVHISASAHSRNLLRSSLIFAILILIKYIITSVVSGIGQEFSNFSYNYPFVPFIIYNFARTTILY